MMGRTRQAEELLEIAFMLCCFRNLGAPVVPFLYGWAKGILWRNGEQVPE